MRHEENVDGSLCPTMVVQVRQLAKEEDDNGGGVALKDCFAKDLSFVIVLLVFFLDWICHLSKGFSYYLGL